MKRLLLAIALLLGLADVAAAQNVTCATRPVTDNSNACANTAFVNSYVNNPSSPIYSTAHTWLATQTFSPVSGTAVALNGTLTMYGDVVLRHPLTPTPDHTASSIIALGAGAGASLAPIHSTEYLTLLGFQAGAALTTEDHITAVGAWTLSSYNAGGTNTGITAIGIDSMRSLTSGQQNVAVGEHTLTTATSASYTTAMGYNSMLTFGNGGTYNSAYGYFSLNGSAGTPATGQGNTAIGSYALTGIAGTGSFNTAVGMQALAGVTSPNGNVGMGYQAGLTVTTGYGNTIIGTFAGSATLATGHDNILIGTTNNVADTPLSSTSNYLNIGNFIYGTSAGLTISPITTTSITAPTVYGGTAAGSTLQLRATSNGAPSGDAVELYGRQIQVRALTGSTVDLVVGQAGTSNGAIYMGGATSGYTVIGLASAAVSGVWTLPSATDTFVGRATTDTLQNKTMSGTGAGNVFTNIPNSALTNASTTVNSQICTLGASCTVTVPISTGVTGLGTGIATALAVNVGTAGAPVINGGALGSPSSVGTLPAHTLGGTISGGGNQINNVVIGASSPGAGTFTTVNGTNITASGYLQASAAGGINLGSNSFVSVSGTFTLIKASDGNQALSFDTNAASAAAYFDNNSSVFRDRSAAATFGTINTNGLTLNTGGLSVGTTQTPSAGQIYINNATYLIRTKTSFTNNAAAATGTLTNAPAAGNPTKWIAIDDNGTTRYIPAW